MKTERFVAAALLVALAACGSAGEGTAQARTSTGQLTPRPPFTLKAQYHTYSQGTVNQLAPWIDVVNAGTTSVALSRVTVRYWFTSGTDGGLQHYCDYTPRGCANLVARFVRPTAPFAQADTYLELGFKEGAGELAGGQSAGEIYQRVVRSDWGVFDQADDYSYDGTHPALADNERVAIYVDGLLVWGVPPGGTGPTDPGDPGTTEVSDAEYAAFIQGSNQLGFDLLKKLTASGESNVVYSPASISFALGMAYLGARGVTAEELAHVLHSELSPGQAATAYGRLGAELATRDVAPYVEYPSTQKELRLRLADALWVQTGFAVEPTYLDAMATGFAAPPRSLDFVAAPDPSRLTINDWVAQATANRIKDLLGPGTVTTQTRLVLTNAVYFKGSWATIFASQLTRPGTFYPLSGATTTASMMSTGNRRQLVYAKGDGWQLVQNPYVKGKLQMTIILPDTGRFAQVRDGLSSTWLAEADARAAPADVNLTLPRFKMEPAAFSLAGILESLGMVEAFDLARADFTGMTPERPLAISDVIHKAYIAVDEAGTEAAAATAVLMSGASPVPPIEFNVNRPFVFLIRDATGAVLFAGQVVQP